MTMSKSPLQILKRMHISELSALADSLSENRTKWTYDKRKKSSISQAVVKNCSREDIEAWLMEFCGKKLPKAVRSDDFERYPCAIQIGETVLGPLGFVKGDEKRSRSKSENTRIVLEQYFEKIRYLEKIVQELEKESSSKFPKISPNIEKKCGLIQIIMSFASDERICDIVNQLLDKNEIRIEISDFYEELEDTWIITKHGMFLADSEKAPVENLADLLKQEFNEEEIAPELDMYQGDFESKLLEFSIRENPELTLTNLFGLVNLKRIAKNFGFSNIDLLHDSHDIATLIMLKLGFDVPPTLVGLRQYLDRLQNYQSKLAGSSDLKVKAGLVSQAYVDLEALLKDLFFFYVGFLWNEEIEEKRHWYDKFEIAFWKILKKELSIKYPERITFGQIIRAIKDLNTRIETDKKIQAKMNETFGRNWILEKGHLASLDEISGQRAHFVHSKKSFDQCNPRELIGKMIDIIKLLQKEKLFPRVVRIIAEIADDYGKNYSKAVDEKGNELTIYFNSWLNTTVPYFMFSKTDAIAVNPVMVQKI